MTTALNIIGFIVGLVVIIKGGDVFVDAAKWIAIKLKIPTFIVGATIVSIATTLPEILVSTIAAAEGSCGLAVGNAIGSVTANTGLIMGISLLFMSPKVNRKELVIRGGMLLAAIGGLWLLSAMGVANGYTLTIIESIFLFILFVVFIFENVHSAKNGTVDIEVDEEQTERKNETIINIFKFIIGIACLTIGSRLLVDCGKFIATDLLHISEAIVGLTIVAVGTSLPEAVTAISAIVKKQGNMSIGNIIGANIIDTSLILPLCALISGGSLPVESSAVMIDMPVCLGIAAIAIIPTIFQGEFKKYQGVIMVCAYIGYIAYMAVNM